MNYAENSSYLASELDWDIKLDFDIDLPKLEHVSLPATPRKLPPREVLKQKFPRILTSVEMLWGSIELHQYFHKLLYSDRENRQGFPTEVMEALGELYAEHEAVLKQRNMLSSDLWDTYFKT
jgi:hypothetical protein